MELCPICNTPLDSMLCPDCGYDRSRDFEHFPTFGFLSAPPEALSRRAAAQADLLRCSRCGGRGFTLRISTRQLRCMGCGLEQELAQLPGLTLIPAPAQLPEPPAENTDAPADPAVTITAVAAGNRFTVVLYSDGTVRAVGHNWAGQCNTDHWTDITAIAASDHTCGLRSDGTVITAGCSGEHARAAAEWTDITAIAAGSGFTAGLRADGTVLVAGQDALLGDVTLWRDPGPSGGSARRRHRRCRRLQRSRSVRDL